MTGKELINLIKKMNLEDKSIYINNGYSEDGATLILNSIKGIQKSDDWNGNKYYLED